MVQSPRAGQISLRCSTVIGRPRRRQKEEQLSLLRTLQRNCLVALGRVSDGALPIEGGPASQFPQTFRNGEKKEAGMDLRRQFGPNLEPAAGPHRQDIFQGAITISSPGSHSEA